MKHLTSDDVIDAVEDMLAPDRRAHLASCAECRRKVADVSGVLGDASLASVPEPSPLFWQHFSDRVNAAIDRDATPQDTQPQWPRWQVLLPLGALAMIVLALMISLPTNEDAPEAPYAPNAPYAPSAPYAPEAPYARYAPDSLSWDTVAALVGPIDLETASAAGVIEPGVAEQAMLELTADEQTELTKLLTAELTRAKS